MELLQNDANFVNIVQAVGEFGFFVAWGFGFQGLAFRVKGSRDFRVQGLGFQGLGF